MDVREQLEVIAYLGDHINYKEDIGICYDSALAKVIENAYMELKNGVTVQKHGRWLLDGRCSECLENPLTTHKTYCPSCGAKMDLER